MVEKKEASTIPQCLIDSEGIFKYVQIDYNNSIYIRGFKKYKYHKGIYGSFSKELIDTKAHNPIVKVLGGGRININVKNKTIHSYGYSNKYGLCSHQITCDIIKQHFTDYTVIWSNTGY